MNETIISITEVEGVTHPRAEESGDSYMSEMDGYRVTTDKQEILLLIDNGQHCCESWGYLWTNDSVDEFIGSTLKGISITDVDLNTIDLPTDEDYDDEPQTMFVTLDTDRGRLQFVAYNAHNGYYGHKALVYSEQLKQEEWL